MCKIIAMPTTPVSPYPLGFQKNKRTHAALLMARSLRKRFTLENLREIAPSVFANAKSSSQSLCLLVKHGFLTKNEEGWQITQAGIDHLYKTASFNAYAASEYKNNGY